MGGIKLLDSLMVNPLKEGDLVLVRMKMFSHGLTVIFFSKQLQVTARILMSISSVFFWIFQPWNREMYVCNNTEIWVSVLLCTRPFFYLENNRLRWCSESSNLPMYFKISNILRDWCICTENTTYYHHQLFTEDLWLQYRQEYMQHLEQHPYLTSNFMSQSLM